MLTAVQVNTTGASFSIGEARTLFGPLIADQGFTYDVSADGQRFLAEALPPDNPGGVLTVVQNWTATLKKVTEPH
jgi:hypothetical protein